MCATRWRRVPTSCAPTKSPPSTTPWSTSTSWGGLGRSAQILGQEGLTDRRQLILQTVRDIMRPDEPLARSILDDTFSEELWSQQAHAADQLSCEVPR